MKPLLARALRAWATRIDSPNPADIRDYVQRQLQYPAGMA